MNNQEFVFELECLIRARYAAICISTYEEERCIATIDGIAHKLGKRVILWTATTGLSLDGKGLDPKSLDFKTSVGMAENLGKEPTLFIFCDAHTYLKNQPVNIRAFKDLCQKLRGGCPSNALLVSPNLEIPIELQKEITILDLLLPDKNETRFFVENFAKTYAGKPGLTVSNEPEAYDKISQACLGLAQSEVENSLAKALVKNKAITENELELILDEKKQIVRKAGILEYISTESFDLSKVGGLHNLKKWLEKRKMAFSQSAKDFGVEYPKGVLLTGIPGCGKSLSAKCVAASWNMPLLKLDMGKIFAGVVGSSEANMRLALNLCEAVAPAILWIDEIEKGLSGSGSGSSDGGTSTRVFGNLLTWMQEKKSPVFIFATANKITGLPPELLRKGRFDEIFFIDLPSEEERKEIFSIVIDDCGRPQANFDLSHLVASSGERALGDGVRLTGSEIEAVVKDALLEAYYRKSVNGDDNDMNTADIIAEIRRIVPMAKSRSDDIKDIRDWASENAVRASQSGASTVAAEIVQEVSVGRNIEF